MMNPEDKYSRVETRIHKREIQAKYKNKWMTFDQLGKERERIIKQAEEIFEVADDLKRYMIEADKQAEKLKRRLITHNQRIKDINLSMNFNQLQALRKKLLEETERDELWEELMNAVKRNLDHPLRYQ